MLQHCLATNKGSRTQKRIFATNNKNKNRTNSHHSRFKQLIFCQKKNELISAKDMRLEVSNGKGSDGEETIAKNVQRSKRKMCTYPFLSTFCSRLAIPFIAIAIAIAIAFAIIVILCRMGFVVAAAAAATAVLLCDSH